MTELHYLSAQELARRIRGGEVSAVEALEVCASRVEKYNDAVNAVVLKDLDRARSRALAADDALMMGELWGPLHGVPMTVKESYNYEGFPTTWGDPSLLGNVATRDAVAVERLESGGAVVYGKTNVPLMLSDWQSFNEIYGCTNNPWDLGRTPGGSSGGAAAALACGMTFLELGSDIGASIRNPAHYCGVFGHKPTMGVVPMRGHLLPGTYAYTDISVGGPLSRSADDLGTALDLLSGSDGVDAAGLRIELPEDRRRRGGSFRAALMLDAGGVCATDGAMLDVLSNAADALGKAGVEVDDKARPDLDMERVRDVYWLLLRSATGARLSDEVVSASAARAAKRDVSDKSYRSFVDRGHALSHRDWLSLHNEREGMRWKWASFFEEYDVLLCPTAASAAFEHDHDGDRADRTIEVNGKREPTVDQLFWAGLSCVAYLPSTVVPAGLTSGGLPSGLQIVGGAMRDRTCLAFAGMAERELGGFTAPPGYLGVFIVRRGG